RIECYFKLLKQAGHDIEAWLQTTPEAILRRLLISCMACVLTWRVQRACLFSAVCLIDGPEMHGLAYFFHPYSVALSTSAHMPYS
ncbi:hypothetical protein ACWKWF_15950, partial [Acinetobacter kookii]